ncbi:MAG: mycothiol synthase [Microbacteriaceae bacterium]|nr:mycothiol synthase [Microbacteriaceae bacterium]
MNDSLRLSVPDLTNPADAAGFYRVADAALDVDGYDPFNEQARLDVESGRRTPVVATVWSEDEHGRPIGAAIVGRNELDLVIDPLFRGKGFGGVALEGILASTPGELTAWSHGDHPAARLLAERHGFTAVRTLLQLRLDPLPDAVAHAGDTAAAASAERPETGATITAFDPSTDEADWVELNARVFASHPEQGKLTIDDLRAREAEPWFDAGDFLLARGEDGRMIGYNWLKIEPGARDGEIYVIGVDAASAGRGLGRRLMTAGLARLAERGCTVATLYVEADSEAAVHLYRSLGFVDHTVDVQYHRAA